MQEFPLEISPQVRKAKYANFTRGLLSRSRVFMAGYEECAPAYYIERNSFPFWTLEFVVGGNGFYREGSNVRPLKHGSAFVYGPGLSQCFWNQKDRPFRKYFMTRGGETFPEAWKQAGLQTGRILQLGAMTSLVTILDQIVQEGQRSDAQSLRVVDGLEDVLMALVSRHQGKISGEKTGSRVAYDLSMDILLKEYRNVQTLSDLAGRSGYSGEYLCRIFKKYNGDSPYQVLLHRKMSAAWLLLRDGSLQVGVVAREVGFDDPMHFSRVFRKIMGCSPSSVKAR